MSEIILFSESGEFCPETGTWSAPIQVDKGQAPEVVEKRIFQYEEFPTLNGRPTKWSMLLRM